jgi:putative tricarboxylic transport membrane protein
VRLIIHGVPGSGPDSLARQVARRLSPWLDAPIELVHKAGDGGAEAIRYLAAHRGDGAVLGTCTPSYLQLPLKGQVDVTVRELSPLARLTVDQYFVAVRSDSPYADLPSLISAAQSKPLRTVGHARGSINHILAHLLREAAGARYQFDLVASTPEIVQALLDGRADWIVATPLEIMASLHRREVRPLAGTGTQPLSALPDIPTCRQVGVPVEFLLWRGLIAPGGLPTKTMDRLSHAVIQMTNTPQWADYLATTRQQAAYLEAEAFSRYLLEEEERYRRWLTLLDDHGSGDREQEVHV